MKTYFNPYYFTAFIILLLVEIAIAIFLKDGFIRFTFGDFLVVILLYCFLKSFLKMKSVNVAIVVLAIAFVIEFSQLANLLELIKLKNNKLAATIFGTSFSIQDLIAYTLGVGFALILDKISTKKSLFNV